jgi:hypothetical protein
VFQDVGGYYDVEGVFEGETFSVELDCRDTFVFGVLAIGERDIATAFEFAGDILEEEAFGTAKV